MTVELLTDRASEVRDILRDVMDPEIDENVIDLDFVTAITVSPEDDVTVCFRLPTYWCSVNFAYLMASDMRDAIESLGWPRQISVRIGQHMYDQAINTGLAKGLTFRDSFPDLACSDLDEIRLKFNRKAFEGRQEDLLRYLLQQGYTPEALVALSLADLEASSCDDEGSRLRNRYLGRRDVAGGQPLAFVTTDGEPIASADFKSHIAHLRRVGLNAQFNASLCRGLQTARYGSSSSTSPIGADRSDYPFAAPDKERPHTRL